MGNCFFRNTPDKREPRATNPTQVDQTILRQCTCQCTCRTIPRTNLLGPEGPVSVIGTPGDLLPPVVIPGVPDPGITIRIGNPPQRILVVTTNEFDEEVLRVTYDDNGTNNQWGFHEGGGSIHVTEVFRTPGLGGLLVEIVGVPPPSIPEVKWHLTVSENDQGVPDRFPKFLPEEPDVNPQLHTQFTMEVQQETQRIAFSFTTTQGDTPQKYYLVPSIDDGVQYIETEEAEETDDPEFVFQTLSLNSTFGSNLPNAIIPASNTVTIYIAREEAEVEQ